VAALTSVERAEPEADKGRSHEARRSLPTVDNRSRGTLVELYEGYFIISRNESI
jgi:hypothetical protein